MNKHVIIVEPRSVLGRAVKKLRSEGILPGNIFGRDLKSVSIQLNSKEFAKLFKQVGESALYYLQLAKGEHPVLVKEVTRHPVSGQLLHVAFQQVDLKQKVTTKVPVELVGESPAQKDGLGVLLQQTDTIEIEALPTDIPEKIELDIASLTEVGSALRVSDISVNTSKVTILTEPETTIVQIAPLAKVEVEVVAAPVEGEVPAEGAVAEGAEPAPTTDTKSEEKSE